MTPENLIAIIAAMTALIISVSTHEAAHGWAAERFGDPTAREQGRITLNPLKHIDPVFSVLVPLILYLTVGIAFGGAKPVPFNPSRFRPGTHLKRAIMWVAAAGPISNFILAFIAQFLIQLADRTMDVGVTGGFTYRFLSNMFVWNIVLGVFNLLPIPPLDGAKVLAGFLPDSLAQRVYNLERFAFLFILGLILLQSTTHVTHYILTPVTWVAEGYVRVIRAMFIHF